MKKNIRIGAWSLCAGLGLAGSLPVAVGQETPGDLTGMSLEDLMQLPVELVYGASRYEQKVTRAPAAVTIVTAEDIRRFGHRTLADVLRSVRGLYVTYERNYSNFGIRGFARPGDFNTRVLLLVDGRRMNDNLYGSALIGPEAILDVDLIERVEIIRGPSSSIYGNSAFFGVINVITRSAGEVRGLEVSGEAGRFDTYEGRITYGNRFGNGAEALLSGSQLDSRGASSLYFPEFDAPETHNGIAHGQDGEQAQSLHARLSQGAWSLAAAYSLRDKEVPTASFRTVFNDGREQTRDIRSYVDLGYSASVAGMQVTSRIYYDYYGYRATYPIDVASPGDPPQVELSRDDTHGEGAGVDVQITRTVFDRHTLVFGGEHRRDLDLYQASLSGEPPGHDFRDRREGWSSGLYAQGEFAFGKNLLLNAGLRFDDFGRFSGRLSPRVGLMYGPGERTAFKLLYGEAYRAPNAYELFQEAPGFSRANPDLDPETIRTSELVWEQYLPRNLRLSASAYHYEIDGLITQSISAVDGIRTFRNLSSLEADGLELELEGRTAAGLTARLSYALQKAEDERSGEALNNSPRHMAKLNVALPLHADRVSLGVEMQYLSELGTLSGDETGGFVITNATLYGRELLKGLDLSAAIYNVFDRDYAYPGSTSHRQDTIPQDGRTFRLKVTYRFAARTER